MPYKYKDLNEFLKQYMEVKFRYSCYDYTSLRQDLPKHYLEKKERRILPTKYNDICVDGGKVSQLLRLNSFTLLVNSFVDGSVYLAYLTIVNESGKVVLSPDVIVTKVKAPATTDFKRNNYVDKTFYSIPLDKAHRIA
jgi:hypothetical protein